MIDAVLVLDHRVSSTVLISLQNVVCMNASVPCSGILPLGLVFFVFSSVVLSFGSRQKPTSYHFHLSHRFHDSTPQFSLKPDAVQETIF